MLQLDEQQVFKFLQPFCDEATKVKRSVLYRSSVDHLHTMLCCVDLAIDCVTAVLLCMSFIDCFIVHVIHRLRDRSVLMLLLQCVRHASTA